MQTILTGAHLNEDCLAALITTLCAYVFMTVHAGVIWCITTQVPCGSLAHLGAKVEFTAADILRRHYGLPAKRVQNPGVDGVEKCVFP